MCIRCSSFGEPFFSNHIGRAHRATFLQLHSLRRMRVIRIVREPYKLDIGTFNKKKKKIEPFEDAVKLITIIIGYGFFSPLLSQCLQFPRGN